MRLTCPSCAAQYEVPPEAIPPAGRDVQCSACGHTWFEQPAGSRPRLVDPEPWDDVPQVEGDEEEADDLAELRAAPPGPAADPSPGLDAPPPRSRVPPEVERILREEARHEAEARAGVDEVRPAPEASLRRLRPRDLPEAAPALAPARQEAPPPPPRPGADAPPARPMRPARQVDRAIDLDRINSTLRSQADQLGARAPQVETGSRPRRSGFGGGFLGTLLILALLAGLYVFRPQIVTALPRSAALLDPYARAVEDGRDWLDRQVGRLLGAEAPPE